MTPIYISKKKFFSFFVISEMVSVLAAQDCFHWQFSIQHFCSICNSKSIKVTAICLLLHWQKSGRDFPEFTNWHFIVTRFKLDVKLSQVCILPLKQRLRNQFVQYLDMVVIYWAERYTYFSLPTQNRLVAFFIAKCFTY